VTSPSPPTFLFAGGGTGGHLYPGIAIARALAAIQPGSRALFLCSDRPIDAKILTDEGVEFRPTPARPFGVRPRALVRFLRSWGASVRFGREVIREARARGPVHIVALGGFVAAPVVQAGRVERVPVTMVNLDAIPGKANRLIARRIASAPVRGAGIFTTLAVPPSHTYAAGWTLVPPIVRPAALARGTPAECRSRLGLDPDRPTLMVTGGSLGASTINTLLLDLARSRPEALKGWQVLHQTGAKQGDQMGPQLESAYAAAGARAIVVPFVAAMGDWWGAADLAISRAGAGSVAEAWANAVPTVFLPYPHHRDQHQRHNAEPLTRAGGDGGGGAVLLTDHVDAAANLAAAAPILTDLLGDAPRRARMREALRSLGPADGAERIARAIVGAAGG
jgi:UDP-N-acetylglucosamine--N-acetylmuramyl-(pentapeptide) pyrophosphoryl-undecaprenol N-acetylglucosamine transferase